MLVEFWSYIVILSWFGDVMVGIGGIGENSRISVCLCVSVA